MIRHPKDGPNLYKPTRHERQQPSAEFRVRWDNFHPAPFQVGGKT